MSLLKDYYSTDNHLEVGIDESGAGCLAGPLYVAAVILPRECPTDEDYYKDLWDKINDSKKLTALRRSTLSDFIKEVAIDYSIVVITKDEIDRINILQARLQGFHRAIQALSVKPDFILVDGDKFNDYVDSRGKKLPHVTIVNGDGQYKSIAAASILAKHTRDTYMIQLSEKFPEYSWHTNKGYGTAGHLQALKTHGITEFHRRSFNLHLTKKTPPKMLFIED